MFARIIKFKHQKSAMQTENAKSEDSEYNKMPSYLNQEINSPPQEQMVLNSIWSPDCFQQNEEVKQNETNFQGV